MNFSHGDYAFHTRMADLVRVRRRCGRASRWRCWPTCRAPRCASAGWTRGADRGGAAGDPGWAGGGRARAAWTHCRAGAVIIPVDFDLAPHMKAGRTILIDDGNIELRIESVIGGHVHCRRARRRDQVAEGRQRALHAAADPGADRQGPGGRRLRRQPGRRLDRAELCRLGRRRERAAGDRRTRRRDTPTCTRPPRIMAKIERPDGVENLRASSRRATA